MRRTILAIALSIPGLAFGAGDDDAPPTPTKTTKECVGQRVWDETKERCVRPKQSSLDQDQLYDAARELAYAGRYKDAQAVLAAMPDQTDDRVLTYYGFTHRKLGDVDAALMFYTDALSKNPDNLLARSYMAQGLVAQGDLNGARAQLAEIEQRGGADTWAGTSLRKAINSGKTFNY